MLTVQVPETRVWDEGAEQFDVFEGLTLHLEHSLLSLSKWEERFHKPFLGPDPKSTDEVLGYMECMILDDEFPPGVFTRLPMEDLERINAYIDDPMTATWITERGPKKRSNEIITNELIYYWMFTNGVPLECERWHLNKLFTQIKVFAAKNEKPKKQSSSDAAAERYKENERRLAAYNTTG